MKDEIIFTGIDMLTKIPELVKQMNDVICEGMTENEKKAYNLGIDNTMQMIAGLMASKEDNEIWVHISGLKDAQEFMYEDLVEIVFEK